MTGAPDARGRSGAMAALWLALLVAGQAATLLLVMAGPHSRYQHLVSPERALGAAPAGPLAVLAIEALAVMVGLVRARRDVARAVGAAGRWWAIVLAAGFLALASAAPSRDAPLFALDLLLSAACQFVHLGAVVLFALAVPPGMVAAVQRAAARLLGGPGRAFTTG